MKFDALFAEYRSEVPGKIAAMEALWAAGQTSELRRALHTLGGSAGTFGLPEVGDAARAAEDCLADNPDGFASAFERLKKLGMALASTG